MITQSIADIKNTNLIENVIGGSGVELKQHGRIFRGLCPCHNDTDPSLIVDPDTQRFHCYGPCGVGGDVIDYVQFRYGVDFKGALNYLGFSGTMTAADKAAIRKVKKMKKRRQAKQRRERELAWTLGTMIRRIEKACDGLTPDNLDEYGGILSDLEWYRWGHDTLINGDKLDRAYVLWSFKGFPALSRNYLFEANFNYSEWVRSTNQGAPDAKAQKAK